MPSGLYDDFITATQCFIEGLEAARNEAAPKVQEAVDRFVAASEKDAKNILNRPKWLLQRSISSKVKQYLDRNRIWAMVGFRFQEKGNRDPGRYGQYHEAGWAKDRRVVRVPHHFLREAKRMNKALLDKEVQGAVQGAIGKIKVIMKERRASKRG